MLIFLLSWGRAIHEAIEEQPDMFPSLLAPVSPVSSDGEYCHQETGEYLSRDDEDCTGPAIEDPSSCPLLFLAGVIDDCFSTPDADNNTPDHSHLEYSPSPTTSPGVEVCVRLQETDEVLPEHLEESLSQRSSTDHYLPDSYPTMSFPNSRSSY
jgi:hypothetical protein